MNFIERMTIWNGGIERGAARRLAKKLRVSEPLVSGWTRNKPPSEVQARKIAAEFGIRVDEVMALFSHPDTSAATRRVPVIGVVHANRFHVAYDGPPLDWIPNFTPEEESFALRITGDCMEPTLHDGEDAYCYPRRTPKNKDVVVVQFDGESTISRLRIIDDVHYLVPDNKKYPREKLHPKMTIRAVVDGAYRRRL